MGWAVSNARLLTGTSQEAGTRVALSPSLQPCGISKTVPLILLPERFLGLWCFRHSWQTLGPHSLCQQLTDGQQNVLQVDKEGTGAAKQQESAQKELGMRRRVSLSLHRGLHAPHIRSRCLFRVYLPPLLFLLPVRPSWADRSSHYLTKWQGQQLSTETNSSLRTPGRAAAAARGTPRSLSSRDGGRDAGPGEDRARCMEAAGPAE